MSHIFISYSRRDLDFAQKIVTALAANDLDTWIDWKSIPKGEDWEQEIYRGIEEADAFLFLISLDSVRSEMCNREIGHAVRNGKRILPIFIAQVDNRGIYGVTESFLQQGPREEINRRNFILCRPERDDFDTALEEVQKTIRTDYDWLRFQTGLQLKALEWERNGSENSFLLNGKELRDIADSFVTSSGKNPSPTDLQRRYLLASQENEELRRKNEERRRRQITLGLSLGLLITAVLATLAWVQRNEANTQRSNAQAASTRAIAQQYIAQTKEAEAIQQAKIAHSRELAAIALNQLSVDQERSLLIALAANEQWHTLEANDALRRAVQAFQVHSILQRCSLQGNYGDDQILGLSYAFSADGRIMAVYCSLPPRQIRIFEVGSAKTLSVIPIPDAVQIVFNLSFSADASTLVYTERGAGGGALAGSAVVWDLARDRQVFVSPDTVLGTYSSLSQDGSKLWFFSPEIVNLGGESFAYVYDTASQEQLARIPARQMEPVGENQIAIQFDYPLKPVTADPIAIPFDDPSGIYNMTTLAKQGFSIGKDQTVESFGSRGELVVRDGQTIRILSGPAGEVKASLLLDSLPPTNQSYFIEVSPDDHTLALVIGQRIEIRTFDDPGSVQTLEGHAGPIGYVEFSGDSRLLVSTSLDTTCRIWDVRSGALLSTINKVLEARFSPDKKQLVVHTEDGNLTLWDLPTRGEVTSVAVGARVVQAWFSENGQQILLTDIYGDTLAWDWQKPDSRLSPAPAGAADKAPRRAESSPDGHLRVSLDENNILRLFDGVTNTLLFENRVSTDQVNDLQFSPDSSMLVLAAGSPFVTDVKGDPGWLPFRTRGELDQTASLWDVRSMQQIAVLRGSTDAVNSAAFSPDSKYVVTAGNDGFVRVYLARIQDLETYARQRILRNPPEFTCEERVEFLKEKELCPTATPTPGALHP